MPVPQENNVNRNAEEVEDEMGEEEEEVGEEEEEADVDNIPPDPAAAMAESRDAYSLLLNVMLFDVCREPQVRAIDLDTEYNAKRAEALEADLAGHRARAAQLFLEAERLKTLWRVAWQEFEDQQKVAGHRWVEDLFRRVRQLEGYTGLSPDPAIRYEALRILHYVSPRLCLNENDTLRVQAFFYRDPAEDPLNVGFAEDANGNDPELQNDLPNGNESPQR